MPRTIPGAENGGVAPTTTMTPQALAPVSVDPAGLQKLREVKAQSANGADMSDAQFAVALHQHYYPDMPMGDFLARSGLDRGDVLYELRAPGDPYGDYLRQSLATPGQGETPDAAAQRQGGSLPQDRPGIGDGIARAYEQGGSFGFGDEAVAAGAAFLDPLVHGDSGKDFGQRFNTYLSREQGKVDQFRQDNPVAAYGAEIAAAIPTSIAAGSELAGQGGTAAAKLFSRAAVGSGQGAVYGFGSTDGDLGDRSRGAGAGALIGAGTELGLSAVQDGFNAAVRAASRNQAVKQAVKAAPMADEIKAGAQASYQAADNSGVMIKPTATALLRHDLGQMLTDEGLVQNGRIGGNFGQVRKAMKHLDSFDGQPMSMKEFQRLEESFQDVAASQKAGEARLGKMMLNRLDDYVDSLPQGAFMGGNGPEAAAAWQAGKAGWASYKRTKVIEDAVRNARLSEGGFANGLRGELRTVLKSDKKRSRFSPDELAEMERFVTGGKVGHFLKALKDNGGLPAAVMGHLLGGLPGAAVSQAPGMGAGLALDAGAQNAGRNLRARVATGGPLAANNNGSLLDLQALIPGATNPETDDQRRWIGDLVFGGQR